jgi:hypothetical protein
VPDPVKSSDLTVRLDLVGRIPTGTNPTSPAIAGSQLLLIDQWGYLGTWDGTSSHLLLSSANLPAGISPVGAEALLNVAANATGSTVYVMFTSSTVPSGIRNAEVGSSILPASTNLIPDKRARYRTQRRIGSAPRVGRGRIGGAAGTRLRVRHVPSVP